VTEDEQRQLLIADLQRKLDGDLHRTVMRTLSLLDDADSTAMFALLLQAACTTQQMLAQMIDQACGHDPARAKRATVVLASMLTLRGTANVNGIALAELLDLAQADARKLRAAGIVRF
jgi:hypothetical protein